VTTTLRQVVRVVVRVVVRLGRGLVWYARELMGDTAYEHYLARFAADHIDAHGCAQQPLSQRDFWRQRQDNLPVGAGCC
jgi:hypothetical protein